jgi:hypothetical protein
MMAAGDGRKGRGIVNVTHVPDLEVDPATLPVAAPAVAPAGTPGPEVIVTVPPTSATRSRMFRRPS